MFWRISRLLNCSNKSCDSSCYLACFGLGCIVGFLLISSVSSTDIDRLSNIDSVQHAHSSWTAKRKDKPILPWDDHPGSNSLVSFPVSDFQESNRSPNPSFKTRKKGTDKKRKSGNPSSNNDSDYTKTEPAESDLQHLTEKALSFGSLVLDFLSKDAKPMSSLFGSSDAFSGRFMPGLGGFKFERREGAEGGGDRGVIDWLARLIGVQGKTLGEFLREYQVHVLYDLVFTFFKWIFFLYAGLLIP